MSDLDDLLKGYLDKPNTPARGAAGSAAKKAVPPRREGGAADVVSDGALAPDLEGMLKGYLDTIDATDGADAKEGSTASGFAQGGEARADEVPPAYTDSSDVENSQPRADSLGQHVGQGVAVANAAVVANGGLRAKDTVLGQRPVVPLGAQPAAGSCDNQETARFLVDEVIQEALRGQPNLREPELPDPGLLAEEEAARSDPDLQVEEELDLDDPDLLVEVESESEPAADATWGAPLQASGLQATATMAGGWALAAQEFAPSNESGSAVHQEEDLQDRLDTYRRTQKEGTAGEGEEKLGFEEE